MTPTCGAGKRARVVYGQLAPPNRLVGRTLGAVLCQNFSKVGPAWGIERTLHASLRIELQKPRNSAALSKSSAGFTARWQLWE